MASSERMRLVAALTMAFTAAPTVPLPERMPAAKPALSAYPALFALAEPPPKSAARLTDRAASAAPCTPSPTPPENASAIIFPCDLASGCAAPSLRAVSAPMASASDLSAGSPAAIPDCSPLISAPPAPDMSSPAPRIAPDRPSS